MPYKNLDERRAYMRAYSRRWYQANKERARERTRASKRKLRETAIAAYGGKCACCNEIEYVFLAIDHVGGLNGRARKTGYELAQDVLNEGCPPEYRVLCHNCNTAISILGDCPHKAASQGNRGFD